MNNLSDFANFGELQIFWGLEAPGGAKRVCAPGAKNPRYASGISYITLHSAKQDSAKRDSAKRDSAKRNGTVAGWLLLVG